jgi:hypothetical protein
MPFCRALALALELPQYQGPPLVMPLVCVSAAPSSGRLMWLIAVHARRADDIHKQSTSPVTGQRREWRATRATAVARGRRQLQATPSASQLRAGLVAHSKRTLTDCGRPRWLAGSWLARRPPNATSAPRCPSTELRGNLAYYSILAAAGLQCATPWPALIRNSSLRNGHVCLFYPPRAYSATPHENTAKPARTRQQLARPPASLRGDCCEQTPARQLQQRGRRATAS